MISRAPEGPAREVFLEQLNDFYVACGRPRYREIADISERLDEFYPLDGDRKRDLPTLSPSGISEVLAGRRKNLPSAGWLAAFVLSCQRRAWELGALDKDPGVSTLPEWHRKLAEAQVGTNSAGPDRGAGQPGDRPAPQADRGAPAAEGPDPGPPRPRANDSGAPDSGRPSGNADHPPGQPPHSPPGPPPDPPLGPPPGPAATLPAARGAARRSAVVGAVVGVGPGSGSGGGGGAQAGSAVALGVARTLATSAATSAATNTDVARTGAACVARSAVPVHLPARLREYVAGYGRYGRSLLADAQTGVMDAIYRVAVLLLGAETVDGDAEAQRLLIYTGAAGHRHALDLLDANAGCLDRLDAAGHAFELAEAAAADDDWTAALAFYECAARCGLPAASVKLADRLVLGGDEQQAVRWLAVAARQGDTMAEIRLEGLRRAGRIPPTDRIPPPGPAADESHGIAPTDS